MSLERAIIKSPKGAQMQLQCLSQRFSYSSERHILERCGSPTGWQLTKRLVLGEHARVLEVPFSSNLLEAVQSRPPTGHPRPGLYAALMNGHTDLARFPMP